MKKCLILCFISFYTLAQSVEITPGSILPQVTTVQRNAIASPKNGMLVFDTNTQSYWFRQSGSWTELPKGGSTANYWQLTGNVLKNTNSGGFWSANSTGLPSNASNTTNPPIAPTSGDGTRLMWIPSRSAFRVGTVANNAKSWDADSIGIFSTAMGYNATASGNASFAMGTGTTASGYSSTAMGTGTIASGFSSTAIGYRTTASHESSTAIGERTTASGFASTAIGYYTTASGYSSTAMGFNTTASDSYSTAMGYETKASGYGSTAMGEYTTASGSSSTAMGLRTTASGNSSTAMGGSSTASGNYSTAMGHKVRAAGAGSFIIGDYVSNPDEPVRSQNADNRFTARFRGGYWFMTTGNSLNPTNENDGVLGARLEPNTTAWAAISDSTKKENFIKANGEEFLAKLSKLKLGSWNYKGNQVRNYGPMAQEIFSAFGQDKLGTVGSDTMVNTLDMDGLLFIFAQALEERTETLKHELQLAKTNMGQLRDEISKLKVENVLQKSESEVLKNDISLMKEQLKVLSKHFTSSENRVPQESE